MARNGSGVYSLPAGTLVTNGDTSDATDINTPFSDLETDANTARPIVAGGTGATSASAARTNLGLAIGTDVQAYDAGLASIAGLTTAADKMVYTTASDTYAVADLTSAGRAILDDADASAQRTTLGLGTAATRAAEDTLTNGANLPDGEAVTTHVLQSRGYTWMTQADSDSSSTALDFTSIPSWVTELIVVQHDFTWTGGVATFVQIGDSGGIETTGYESLTGTLDGPSVAYGVSATTSGFHSYSGTTTHVVWNILKPFSGDTWVAENKQLRGYSAQDIAWGAGAKTLSATLDRVRVTTTAGTATFDNGSVNVGYR